MEIGRVVAQVIQQPLTRQYRVAVKDAMLWKTFVFAKVVGLLQNIGPVDLQLNAWRVGPQSSTPTAELESRINTEELSHAQSAGVKRRFRVKTPEGSPQPPMGSVLKDVTAFMVEHEGDSFLILEIDLCRDKRRTRMPTDDHPVYLQIKATRPNSEAVLFDLRTTPFQILTKIKGMRRTEYMAAVTDSGRVDQISNKLDPSSYTVIDPNAVELLLEREREARESPSSPHSDPDDVEDRPENLVAPVAQRTQPRTTVPVHQFQQPAAPSLAHAVSPIRNGLPPHSVSPVRNVSLLSVQQSPSQENRGAGLKRRSSPLPTRVAPRKRLCPGPTASELPAPGSPTPTGHEPTRSGVTGGVERAQGGANDNADVSASHEVLPATDCSYGGLDECELQDLYLSNRDLVELARDFGFTGIFRRGGDDGDSDSAFEGLEDNDPFKHL